jgi:uncharacterized protein YjeT (DUF2065 family)
MSGITVSGAGIIPLGLGFVMVAEGLLLALAPRRIDQALDLVRSLSPGTRRTLGLIALATGIAFIWLAERLSG